MSLSTLLLIVAMIIGILGAFGARFRSDGTRPADLFVGLFVGTLALILSSVVLVIVSGLDIFGVLHLVYLILVVGVPLAIAFIVMPHHLNREYRTPIVAWIMSLIAIGLVASGLWGTHVVPNRLEVERVGLGSTGVQRPVVVGVIADLQTGSIGERERKAAELVLDAEPDIIVIPGDLYQMPEEEFAARAPEFVGWLRTLSQGADHVIIVNGDSDHAERIDSLAIEAGVTYLNDDIIDLELDGQRVTVVGLHTGDDDRSAINQDVTELLNESYTDRDLVLMVSHAPDPVLSLEATTVIDLTIAGHTHGGQVALPGIGPLITFTNIPTTAAAGGLHLVNDQPLYVSTGVGLERLQAPQLRFGVTPTVGIITIVPS